MKQSGAARFMRARLGRRRRRPLPKVNSALEARFADALEEGRRKLGV